MKKEHLHPCNRCYRMMISDTENFCSDCLETFKHTDTGSVTPEREYRSCLNCQHSKYNDGNCKNSLYLLVWSDYYETETTLHNQMLFDNPNAVEEEIKDVIGKHCKLFKAISKNLLTNDK